MMADLDSSSPPPSRMSEATSTLGFDNNNHPEHQAGEELPLSISNVPGAFIVRGRSDIALRPPRPRPQGSSSNEVRLESTDSSEPQRSSSQEENQNTAIAAAASERTELAAVASAVEELPNAIGIRVRHPSIDHSYRSNATILGGSVRVIVDSLNVEEHERPRPYHEIIIENDAHRTVNKSLRWLVMICCGLVLVAVAVPFAAQRYDSRDDDGDDTIATDVESDANSTSGRHPGTIPQYFNGTYSLNLLGTASGMEGWDKFGASLHIANFEGQSKSIAPGRLALVGASGPLEDQGGFSGIFTPGSESTLEPIFNTTCRQAETVVFMTHHGDHLAIGCPSFSQENGLGYVEVYIFHGTSREYYLLDTVFGEMPGDGFGSSVSLLQRIGFGSQTPLRLAVGSYAGYVHVFENIRDKGKFARIDSLAFDYDRPGDEDRARVVVAQPSIQPGNHFSLLLGYPDYLANKGLVKAYSLDTDVDANVVVFEQVGSELHGNENGDGFGASLSVDQQGLFVAVGSQGGGYVKAFGLSSGDWIQVGQTLLAPSTHEKPLFGSSVSTGKIPFGSCRSCAYTVDGFRIIIGSPAYSNYSDNMVDDEGTTAGNGKAIVVQFDKDADQWMGVGDIVGNDRNEGLGTSVAMSEGSTFVAVGSPFANNGRGKVSLYMIESDEPAGPPDVNANSTIPGGRPGGGKPMNGTENGMVPGGG